MNWETFARLTLLFIGCAYIVYLDVFLEPALMPFDHFATVILAMLGVWFIVSKAMLGFPWLERKLRSLLKASQPPP
jgi:hypothetical protein